ERPGEQRQFGGGGAVELEPGQHQGEDRNHPRDQQEQPFRGAGACSAPRSGSGHSSSQGSAAGPAGEGTGPRSGPGTGSGVGGAEGLPREPVGKRRSGSPAGTARGGRVLLQGERGGGPVQLGDEPGEPRQDRGGPQPQRPGAQPGARGGQQEVDAGVRDLL